MCRSKAQGGRRCPSSQRRAKSVATVGNSSSLHFNLEQVPSWIRESITLGETVPSPIPGITSQNISGEIVDYGYVNRNQLSGKINPANLNHDSYKDFGFSDPREREPENEEEDYEVIFDEEAFSHRKFALAEEENNVIIANNEEAGNAINTYTGYEWSHVVNQSLIQDEVDSLSEENQKKIRLINDVARESLHVQRTVYRGLKLSDDAYSTYMSKMEIGQEIYVDSFQSTSLSRLVAHTFTLNEDVDQRVMLEIITPEGFNISEQSQYPSEQEVILPHHTRYMVVGKHLPYPDSDENTVLQLVAIDDNSNILV